MSALPPELKSNNKHPEKKYGVIFGSDDEDAEDSDSTEVSNSGDIKIFELSEASSEPTPYPEVPVIDVGSSQSDEE